MYVAVKGGETAIDNAHRLLAEARRVALVQDRRRALAAADRATGPVSTRFEGSERCRSGWIALTSRIARSTPE